MLTYLNSSGIITIFPFVTYWRSTWRTILSSHFGSGESEKNRSQVVWTFDGEIRQDKNPRTELTYLPKLVSTVSVADGGKILAKWGIFQNLVSRARWFWAEIWNLELGRKLGTGGWDLELKFGIGAGIRNWYGSWGCELGENSRNRFTTLTWCTQILHDLPFRFCLGI